MEKETLVGWCLIPAWVMVREDLTLGEKVLYGRILGLADKKGYCFASNDHLGKELGLSASRITDILRKLEDNGIIKRNIIRNENQQVIERQIYPLFMAPPSKNQGTSLGKRIDPSLGKHVHSNRDISNRDSTLLRNVAPLSKKPKILGEKILYGARRKPNQDIDEAIAYLKAKMGLPKLGDTENGNRNFARHCLRKYGGLDKVKLLIDAAWANDFWRYKIASFDTLYHKGVQIISETRDGGGKYGREFIDARNI